VTETRLSASYALEPKPNGSAGTDRGDGRGKPSSRRRANSWLAWQPAVNATPNNVNNRFTVRNTQRSSWATYRVGDCDRCATVNVVPEYGLVFANEWRATTAPASRIDHAARLVRSFSRRRFVTSFATARTTSMDRAGYYTVRCRDSSIAIAARPDDLRDGADGDGRPVFHVLPWSRSSRPLSTRSAVVCAEGVSRGKLGRHRGQARTSGWVQFPRRPLNARSSSTRPSRRIRRTASRTPRRTRADGCVAGVLVGTVAVHGQQWQPSTRLEPAARRRRRIRMSDGYEGAASRTHAQLALVANFIYGFCAEERRLPRFTRGMGSTGDGRMILGVRPGRQRRFGWTRARSKRARRWRNARTRARIRGRCVGAHDGERPDDRAGDLQSRRTR